MPSKNTSNYKVTKETKDELEKIRLIISKELGIDINDVKIKHAEIVFRLKASRGKINVKEIQDIMLGKIK